MNQEIETLDERLNALTKKLESLGRRLDLLVANMPAHIETREAPPPGSVEGFYGASSAQQESTTPGLVPRGKYAGRNHADVVQLDPSHVVWLADNGHAAGFGYTAEQIAEARAKPQELRPMVRIKKPSYR